MLQFETKSTQITKNQKTRRRQAATAVDSADSWDVQFAPKRLSDLAIYGPKVTALRNWILGALSDDSLDGIPHVLALCGNSGCGKSTAMELLSSELEIELVHWNEDCWDVDGRSDGLYQQYRLNNTRQNVKDRLVDSLFNLETDGHGALSTKSETLRSFASMSKYPTLSLQPKSSVPAKPPAPASKNAVTISKGARDLMAAQSKKKLVLIHDPPFQYMKHSVGGSGGTAESAGKEAAMFEYIASFDCPVVMIVSALSGQDDAPFAVEKCIPHSVRSRIKFDNLFFPPIADKKIEGVLNSILDKVGARITDEVSLLVPSIAAGSCGDLRHAILQLQFKLTQSYSTAQGKATDKKEKSDTGTGQVDLSTVSDNLTDRDSSLSSLHSIGKLLHAKLNRCGQLNFSSDWVVEQMELPLDIALCFLQGNCILNASHSAPCLAYQTIKPSSTAMKKRRKKDSTDMHSLLEDSNSIFLHWRGISEASGVDIAAMVDALAVEQICATLTYFSDCDILLSKKYDSSFLMDRSSSSSGGGGSSGGVALFPEGYVSTICGKACAVGKGSGFKELYERGQLGGFTGSFAAIHRPKSLDIRMNYLSEKRKAEVRQLQFLKRAIWDASGNRISSSSSGSGGGRRSDGRGGGQVACIPTLVSMFDVATLLNPYDKILAPGSSSVHNSSSIEEEGYHYADLQHPQQQSTSGETHLTDDIEDFNE